MKNGEILLLRYGSCWGNWRRKISTAWDEHSGLFVSVTDGRAFEVVSRLSDDEAIVREV